MQSDIESWILAVLPLGVGAGLAGLGFYCAYLPGRLAQIPWHVQRRFRLVSALVGLVCGTVMGTLLALGLSGFIKTESSGLLGLSSAAFSPLLGLAVYGLVLQVSHARSGQTRLRSVKHIKRFLPVLSGFLFGLFYLFTAAGDWLLGSLVLADAPRVLGAALLAAVLGAAGVRLGTYAASRLLPGGQPADSLLPGT